MPARPDGQSDIGLAPRRTPADVAARYPWLATVNPRGTADPTLVNCLLTALAVDISLATGEGHVAGGHDGANEHEILNYAGAGHLFRVPGFGSIVESLTQAGRGARGIVTVASESGVTHAFVAVHDADGVVFLDGQTGREATVPPGQGRLRFVPTGDVPVTVVDGEPVPAGDVLVGRLGLESEEYDFVLDLDRVVYPRNNEAVITYRTLEMKIDGGRLWRDQEGNYYKEHAQIPAHLAGGAYEARPPILELVGPPLAVLPGEPHTMTEAELFRLLDDVWQRLSTVPAEGARLDEVFPPELGFQFPWRSETIRGTIIKPIVGRGGPRGRYLQYTMGLPVSALWSLHQWLADPDRTPVQQQRETLIEGLDFGAALAARFAGAPEGLGYLVAAADPVARTLAGYAAVLYAHVAGALLNQALPGAQVPKNRVAALIRAPLSSWRADLPPAVAVFLESQEAWISDTLVSSVLRGTPDYFAKWAREHVQQEVPETLLEVEAGFDTAANYLRSGLVPGAALRFDPFYNRSHLVESEPYGDQRLRLVELRYFRGTQQLSMPDAQSRPFVRTMWNEVAEAVRANVLRGEEFRVGGQHVSALPGVEDVMSTLIGLLEQRRIGRQRFQDLVAALGRLTAGGVRPGLRSLRDDVAGDLRRLGARAAADAVRRWPMLPDVLRLEFAQQSKELPEPARAAIARYAREIGPAGRLVVHVETGGSGSRFGGAGRARQTGTTRGEAVRAELQRLVPGVRVVLHNRGDALRSEAPGVTLSADDGARRAAYLWLSPPALPTGLSGPVAEGGDGLAHWRPQGERDEVFGQRYGWLRRVNDEGAGTGDGWLVNCVLTAIATHLTLAEPDQVFVAPPVDESLPPADVVTYANDGRTGEPRVLAEVDSYGQIAEAVGAAGPGAHGFVVVAEPGGERGHVFNVVRDDDGVVFLDGQTGDAARLPGGPYRKWFIAVGPVDVPPIGRPVAEADLPAVVGAHAEEVELHSVALGEIGERLPEKTLLVESSDGLVRVVADNKTLYYDHNGVYYGSLEARIQAGGWPDPRVGWVKVSIPEVVTRPVTLLAGEQGAGPNLVRAWRDDVLERLRLAAQVRDVYHESPTTLAELFPHPAYRVAQHYRNLRVTHLPGVRAEAPFFAQFTEDVPLAGLPAFLDHVIANNRTEGDKFRYLAQAVDFGWEVAAMHLERVTNAAVGDDDARLLAADPDVAALVGAMALVFIQAAGALHHTLTGHRFMKWFMVVAVRHPLWALGQALHPSVRETLSLHAPRVREAFGDHFAAAAAEEVVGGRSSAGLLATELRDEDTRALIGTVRTLLDEVLAPSAQGPRITAGAFGIGEAASGRWLNARADGGNPLPPTVALELRSYGRPFVSHSSRFNGHVTADEMDRNSSRVRQAALDADDLAYVAQYLEGRASGQLRRALFGDPAARATAAGALRDAAIELARLAPVLRDALGRLLDPVARRIGAELAPSPAEMALVRAEASALAGHADQVEGEVAGAGSRLSPRQKVLWIERWASLGQQNPQAGFALLQEMLVNCGYQ